MSLDGACGFAFFFFFFFDGEEGDFFCGDLALGDSGSAADPWVVGRESEADVLGLRATGGQCQSSRIQRTAMRG